MSHRYQHPEDYQIINLLSQTLLAIYKTSGIEIPSELIPYKIAMDIKNKIITDYIKENK